MKRGDIIRFVRTPPANPYDTGIWSYEYGLLIRFDKRLKKVLILSNDQIISAESDWCSIAEEEKDFIDDLAERSRGK